MHLEGFQRATSDEPSLVYRICALARSLWLPAGSSTRMRTGRRQTDIPSLSRRFGVRHRITHSKGTRMHPTANSSGTDTPSTVTPAFIASLIESAASTFEVALAASHEYRFRAYAL